MLLFEYDWLIVACLWTYTFAGRLTYKLSQRATSFYDWGGDPIAGLLWPAYWGIWLGAKSLKLPVHLADWVESKISKAVGINL